MKALSIRQPWAWAIIHAGKNIENRSAAAVKHMNFFDVKRLANHASKGMTRDEYEEASEFLASIGVACPPAVDLLRGGVIGTVAIVGVVKQSQSPWFFGPRGIVLKDPVPMEFDGCVGMLGLFDYDETWLSGGYPERPARWMLKQRQDTAPAADPPPGLFGEWP